MLPCPEVAIVAANSCTGPRHCSFFDFHWLKLVVPEPIGSYLDKAMDAVSTPVTGHTKEESRPETDMNSHVASDWSFANLCDERRVHCLENPPPFDTILDRLLECQWFFDESKECGKAPDGEVPRAFWRYGIRAEVTPQLFDLFFNSRSGYRAIYYLDQELGERVNRQVIQAACTVAGVDAACLPWFLDGSAKVWFDENNVAVPKRAQASQAEVCAPRWLENLNKENAQFGVNAFKGCRIVVFSAFRKARDEPAFVPAGKKDRSKHLHEYGFS